VRQNFEDGLRNDSLDRSRSREGRGGVGWVLKVDRVVKDRIEKVVGRTGRGFLENRLRQRNVVLWFFLKNLGQV
jgi:hypothetical protein